MFNFIKAIARFVSRKAARVVKRSFKVVRRPVKTLKKKALRALKPQRTFARKISRTKRIGSLVKYVVSPKERSIVKLQEKMRVIENLVYSENELLGMRTSTQKEMSMTSQRYVENPKLLRILDKNELDSVNKAIDNELKGLGIDSAEDVSRAINDDQFREDIVKTNSFKDFMENWKNGFFAYDPEDLGMSEDERQIIWEEIEASKTYHWFVENKVKG